MDRNPGMNTISYIIVMSLSARRAWIEIEFTRLYKALAHGRSPQGERG